MGLIAGWSNLDAKRGRLGRVGPGKALLESLTRLSESGKEPGNRVVLGQSPQEKRPPDGERPGKRRRLTRGTGERCCSPVSLLGGSSLLESAGMIRMPPSAAGTTRNSPSRMDCLISSWTSARWAWDSRNRQRPFIGPPEGCCHGVRELDRHNKFGTICKAQIESLQISNHVGQWNCK